MVVTAAAAVYCEFAFCAGEYFRAAWVAVTVIFPSVLFFLGRYYWGVPVACIAMLIPAIWAFRAECVEPFSGGGAKMAFLAVALYGVPAALILGGLVGHALRSKHAG